MGAATQSPCQRASAAGRRWHLRSLMPATRLRRKQRQQFTTVRELQTRRSRGTLPAGRDTRSARWVVSGVNTTLGSPMRPPRRARSVDDLRRDSGYGSCQSASDVTFTTDQSFNESHGRAESTGSGAPRFRLAREMVMLRQKPTLLDLGTHSCFASGPTRTSLQLRRHGKNRVCIRGGNLWGDCQHGWQEARAPEIHGASNRGGGTFLTASVDNNGAPRCRRRSSDFLSSISGPWSVDTETLVAMRAEGRSQSPDPSQTSCAFRLRPSLSFPSLEEIQLSSSFEREKTANGTNGTFSGPAIIAEQDFTITASFPARSTSGTVLHVPQSNSMASTDTVRRHSPIPEGRTSLEDRVFHRHEGQRAEFLSIRQHRDPLAGWFEDLPDDFPPPNFDDPDYFDYSPGVSPSTPLTTIVPSGDGDDLGNPSPSLKIAPENFRSETEALDTMETSRDGRNAASNKKESKSSTSRSRSRSPVKYSVPTVVDIRARSRSPVKFATRAQIHGETHASAHARVHAGSHDEGRNRSLDAVAEEPRDRRVVAAEYSTAAKEHHKSSPEKNIATTATKHVKPSPAKHQETQIPRPQNMPSSVPPPKVNSVASAFSESNPLSPETIAERRNKITPQHLDMHAAHLYAQKSAQRHGKDNTIIVQRAAPDPIPPVTNTPVSPVPSATPELLEDRLESPTTEDFDSTPSAYSMEFEEEHHQEGVANARVSPLRVQKDQESVDTGETRSVLAYYNTWRGTPVDPSVSSSGILAPFRGDASAENQYLHTGAVDTPFFSPLTPFFQTQGVPAARKAQKDLIGDNGWLEKTSTNEEVVVQKPEPKVSPRKAGFFGGLIKKAKDMVDMAGDKDNCRSRDSKKTQQRNSRSLAISLNPREQSLLYCELEFALNNGLNQYITGQFNAGHLDTDKLKKTADVWQQKGRPKVQGFRYDLETQLDLVRAHVGDFKFYSRAAAQASIYGIIDMMRINARAMRVRTFCQPDTVIAKQLLDSQALFNVLGSAEAQHIQVAEIIGFFKAAVDRERHYANLREEEEQRLSDLAPSPPDKDPSAPSQHSSPRRNVQFQQHAGHLSADDSAATGVIGRAITTDVPVTNGKPAGSLHQSRSQPGVAPPVHAATAKHLRHQKSTGLARWNTDNARAVHPALRGPKDPAEFAG